MDITDSQHLETICTAARNNEIGTQSPELDTQIGAMLTTKLMESVARIVNHFDLNKIDGINLFVDVVISSKDENGEPVEYENADVE